MKEIAEIDRKTSVFHRKYNKIREIIKSLVRKRSRYSCKKLISLISFIDQNKINETSNY